MMHSIKTKNSNKITKNIHVITLKIRILSREKVTHLATKTAC